MTGRNVRVRDLICSLQYSDLVIPALPSIIDPPAAPVPGGKRPRRAPAERRAGGGCVCPMLFSRAI